MTKIDFYLLEKPTEHNPYHYACRLIEKAFQRKHQIYVYLADTGQAGQFDDLLWTFHDISFIPHQQYPKSHTDTTVPVLLGNDTPPANFQDLLINLTDNIPAFYQQFARLIEIIPADEAKKKLARGRYMDYRAQGFEITTHKIT